jgi:hypothetical protein
MQIIRRLNIIGGLGDDIALTPPTKSEEFVEYSDLTEKY